MISPAFANVDPSGGPGIGAAEIIVVVLLAGVALAAIYGLVRFIVWAARR